MVIELIVIITAIFSLVIAILGLDIFFARSLIAIFFIIYGLFHFPYQVEDRYLRPGLGTGCIIIALSGVLSLIFISWWFLPLALLGYLIASFINAKYYSF